MTQLKKLFNIELLKENIVQTTKRFPVSIIFIFMIAWLFFTLLHGSFSQTTEDQLLRVIFSSIIWFFLSVWTYISTENNKNKNIFQIFPIIFSGLFYLWFWPLFDDFENAVMFFLTLAGILSYLFFAPYVKKFFYTPVKETVFYSYFYNISTVFLTAIIVWGSLFALWAIAIWAIDMLFDINYSYTDKLYWDWSIIALSILAPLFALTQIPEKNTFSENYFNENKFFSFLIKYVAVPFICIYFIILYAYTLKVLAHFSEWPKWEVTWLVIWFSTFGFITYIFSYIFETKNSLIALFRRIFPFAVFPQIFMLFYAIYLRIHQYDLTINRYFVVIFWIWLLWLSLYYIVSKNKRLSIIPASLTLITIIISIWPWSVYSLPESRQLERLKTNLVEANILENGQITPLTSETDISWELSKEIYWGIDYLCGFDNCNTIKQLFPKIYAQILVDTKEEFEKQRAADLELYKDEPWYFETIDTFTYREPNKWQIVTEITNKLKVKNYFEATRNQEFIYISLDYSKNFFPMDTTNYSKVYEIRGETREVNAAQLNIQNQTIQIPDGTSYDISPIIEKLVLLYNTPWLTNPITDPNLLEFEIDWARIYIRNINVKNPDYVWEKSDYSYYWAQWYILIP